MSEMKRCPYCAEEIRAEAIKCRYCGSWLEQPGGPEGARPVKKLTRSVNDRMVAGICGGIAKAAGIDSTVVRIVALLLMLLTAVVPGLVLYFLLIFVIPLESAYD